MGFFGILISHDDAKVVARRAYFVFDQAYLSFDQAYLLFDHVYFLFDHAKVVARRAKVTLNHAKVVTRRVKVSLVHTKVVARPMKVLSNHIKVVARLVKVSLGQAKVLVNRISLDFVNFFVRYLLFSIFIYFSISLNINNMAPVTLKIKCRIDELPVLGSFLLSSMQASLADFTGYSPDYNAAFMTTANADLAAVEALINPKQVTAELKVITTRMYNNMNSLRGKIDLLEGYINRATGLTIGKKDFGISEVRKKNNIGDVEGLVGALSFLLTNVANNTAALTAKGFTPAQNTALTTLKNDLKTDNVAQNNKVNERNNKVIANYGKLNLFWDKIADIADAGKRIYKSTAQNKVDDYTMTKLKARIRQERNNTRFEGTVTSNGAPLNGAKIELKPLAGGRRRTTKSKASGVFEITSMEAGDYGVVVTASGKTTIDAEITIVTGTPTSKNFDLV